MAPALPTAAPVSVEPAKPAIADFRLGDEDVADASESDGDQSATSERSLSPSRTEGKVTKSSKRRERKRIGALTDGLDTLLGAAFTTPNADSSTTGVTSGTTAPTDDTLMQVEPTPGGKKMNKRTRQNMAKMYARKKNDDKCRNIEDSELQTQAAAAARRGMSLEEYRKHRKHGGRDMTKASARKLRKQETRAKKAAAEADKMEIG